MYYFVVVDWKCLFIQRVVKKIKSKPFKAVFLNISFNCQ